MQLDSDLFSLLVDRLEVGVFILDPSNYKVIYANDYFTALVALGKKDLLNLKNIFSVISPKSIDYVKQYTEFVLSDTKSDEIKKKHVRFLNSKHSNCVFTLFRFSKIKYKGNTLLFASCLNTTGFIKERKQLRQKAELDFLTGAYNRLSLKSILSQLYNNNLKKNDPCGILMIDLDKFKCFNDTFGHSFGDKVLKQIAAILKESIRKTDALIRFGGDEFIIIMPQINKPKDLIKIAFKIKERISSAYIEGQQVSVSIGASLLNADIIENKDSFIELADKALYKAKKLGGNKIRWLY